MDIFKFITDLSTVQTCCIDTSCQDSFINFSFQHGDFDSVATRTFLEQDDFVSPCQNCSFLLKSDYMSDYVNLDIIPFVISQCISPTGGYRLLDDEWLPGSKTYTLYGKFPRILSTRDHHGSRVRRNMAVIVTILPEENELLYTHMRYNENPYISFFFKFYFYI